jgi:hypothetical protein
MTSHRNNRDRQAIESDAREGAGWLALPPFGDARFLLPRGPRRVAVAGLGIYHPMTTRGRLAWEAARLAARLGALRLIPRGKAPPQEVTGFLSDHVPSGGSFALQRATHEGRWVALVIDRRGEALKLVKVATSESGETALQKEAENIARFSQYLIPPLRAPRLISRTPNTLVFEPVHWVPRSRPWELPTGVAHALGSFTAANREVNGSISHGDFAPWNLLKTRSGWVVIDWEEAGEGPAPMTDLFHYVVQAHGHLGRPTQREIEDALDNRDSLGRVMTEVAQAARVDRASLHDAFREYLLTSRARLDPELPEHRLDIATRDRLLAGSS